MASALPQRSHRIDYRTAHLTRKRGVFYWRRRLPSGRGEVAFSLRTRHFRHAEFLAERADAAYERALASDLADPTAAAKEAMATIRIMPMVPQLTAEQRADLRYAIDTGMEQLWSAGLSFPAPVEGGVETPAPVRIAPAASPAVSPPTSTVHPMRRNASTFEKAYFAHRETEKGARHQPVDEAHYRSVAVAPAG